MKALLLGLGSAVLVAAPAVAHHSWASNYRGEDPLVEIDGVISKLDWKNPHVRMEVTVDAGKPTAKTWAIESSSVAQLSRMAVTPGLVRVGQKVKVAGFGGVQNPTSMYMNHLLLPDGREIVFSEAKPRWSSQKVGERTMLNGTVIEPDINKRPASILAVWTTVYGDPDSHAAARARVVSNGMSATPASAQPAVKPSDATYCAPKAMPIAMGNPYPMQLLKSGKDVVIKLEENDQVRTVYISNTHDDSRAQPTLMGYSTGAWVGEGDKKLVVTTTKIDNKALGARARLTETFQLSADRNRLEYTASMLDPDKSPQPSASSKYWQYRPGVKVEKYDCSL